MAPDGGPKSFGYHGCPVQAISPGNGGRGENPHSSADDRGPRKGALSFVLWVQISLGGCQCWKGARDELRQFFA